MQIKEQLQKGLVFFLGFPHQGPWWGSAKKVPQKNTSPFWAFANLQIKEQKKIPKKTQVLLGLVP